MTNQMYLGANKVDNVYLGATKASAVYLGANKVWPNLPKFSLVTSVKPSANASSVGSGGIVATGNKAYVGFMDSTGKIAVFNTTTQSVLSTIAAGTGVTSLAVGKTTVGVVASTDVGDIFININMSDNSYTSVGLSSIGASLLAANVQQGTFCVAKNTQVQVIGQNGTVLATDNGLPYAVQSVVGRGSYFYVVYNNTAVLILSATDGHAITTITASNGAGLIYTTPNSINSNVYLPNGGTFPSYIFSGNTISGITASALTSNGAFGGQYSGGFAISDSYLYWMRAKGDGTDYFTPLSLSTLTVQPNISDINSDPWILGCFNNLLYVRGDSSAIAVYDTANNNSLVMINSSPNTFVQGLAVSDDHVCTVNNGTMVDFYTLPT